MKVKIVPPVTFFRCGVGKVAILACAIAAVAFAQRAVAQSAATAPPISLKGLSPEWQKALGLDLLNAQQKAEWERFLGNCRAQWIAEAMKAQPAGGEPVAARPPTITLGKHWIKRRIEQQPNFVTQDKLSLELEDGTVWEVAPYGQTAKFKSKDEVFLSKSDSPSYEYMLSLTDGNYSKGRCYLIPAKSAR